ncbi:nitrogen assimilation transcription factor nit-4 [Ophiostoma piceae UAMH 11346]|uniref:Nitrogen assimilation transcription factor nit-4 n=1 Tax=Ophiostoma piceae (strain UAMH 11346) TaxID=1262450 RepID=S3CYB9_OPHP1|nr:nitrogen assimilation transcription factor nit-4 [Ophiostoma piceae UAMH 11346]
MPETNTSSGAAPSPDASTLDGHVSQKKRIRAIVACSHCRSKRSKCDGIPGQHACTQCQQRGIECEMSDGKRNRGHYKPQAEALARRVRVLEEALAEARAANHQLIARMQQRQQQQGTRQSLSGHTATGSFVSIPSTAWDPNSHHMQMDDMSGVSGVSVGLSLQDHRLDHLDHLDHLDVESVHSIAMPPAAESLAASSTMPPPPAHSISPSGPHNAQHNLLLDHGSIVMSAIGTGDMYNDAANKNSNAHNHAMSVSQSSLGPSPVAAHYTLPPSTSPPSTHTVNLAIPIPMLRRQPCCAAFDLSSPVVDYLLGLFFHRYQQMMKFVSQQEFMTQYAENTDTGTDDRDGAAKNKSNKTRSFRRHHPCCHKQNCALFLAMLAAAIRYSTRADVTERFIRPDGENKLVTAARRAVETEVSRPTLATVQTILILCEIEATLDNQMTSYMYACLASRLIFEIGLDLGSSTSSKALTAEETTIRHWLVWAASVHDQFWAVFLRRPLAIKNSALRLSRMAWRFASGDQQRKYCDMHANNSNNNNNNSSSNNNNNSSTPEPTESAEMGSPPTFEDEVNEHLLDLMELAREITDELYGAGGVQSPKQQPSAASSGLNGGSEDLAFAHDNNRTDGGSDDYSTYYNQYDGDKTPHVLHKHAAQQHADNPPLDIAKLDARLDQWFSTLPEKVRLGPVSGQDCYHFLFVLHLHFNAIKITLHRTRAYTTQIGRTGRSSAVPPSFIRHRHLAANLMNAGGNVNLDLNLNGRSQQSSASYNMQSPQASFVESDESAAVSVAALGQASITIAKLFETFRRREDIRTLQCTGVQWASMASEALTWYIETLPIDGAIEAVAHLQSLGRTIKDMTRTFLPAVYTYDRTMNALRMFQQRIDGGGDSPPQVQVLQQQPQQQQYQQQLASQVTSAAMNHLNHVAHAQTHQAHQTHQTHQTPPQPRSISSFDMGLSAAHNHARTQNFGLGTPSGPSVPDLTPSVAATTFSTSMAATGGFDTGSAAGSLPGPDGSVSALSMPTTKEQLQYLNNAFSAATGQVLAPAISAGAIQLSWPENGSWDWGDMLDRH